MIQFFRSYLIGYLFWLGIALGSMAILMVHHLTGGAWGFAIRNELKSAIRTLPILALLALPAAFGLKRLYPWTGDEHLPNRAYLNVPFFSARAVVYFAAWLTLAHFLVKTPDEQKRRLQLLSGAGLGMYALTITFASIDWIMSLQPHWFSTIFGVILAIGQIVAAFAFAIVTPRERDTGQLHDLGNLLLAFVMFWAYVAFSQYLIIWSANIREETPWYIGRLGGGWQLWALALIVFHFAVPFLLLLSRSVKRNRQFLTAIALGLLLARWMDLVWLVEPAFHPRAVYVHWMDVALPLGLGGAWFWRLRHV